MLYGKDSEDHTKTSSFGVAVNALNIIGGTSFLGLSYAFRQSGLIVGSAILMLMCFLTDVTHQLLVECSKFHPILRHKHIDSYEDLVSIPFGKVGEYVLMSSVFVVSFGATVEYLIMIKDMMPILIGLDNQRNLVVFVMWLFFAVPLTMLKNLSSLAFVSGLSLLLSLYLAIVMIYDCPISASIESHGGLAAVTQEYWFRPNVFATISILTEALAWQHGAFTVFNSLQEATLRRWRLVTGSVNTMACILYAAVAIPGYLSYLDSTDGDIFLNFPDSSLFNVARMFFSFIVIMTYPIEMLIARDVTLSFIRRNEIVESTSDCSVKKDEPQKSSGWGKYLVSGKELMTVMVLNLIALGLGIWLRDLGVVLAFVGAIGGSTACFIMPGLIYIGVNGSEFLELLREHMGAPEVVESCKEIQFIHDEKSSLADKSISFKNVCITCKPWWFNFFGFPIWCHLASVGIRNLSGIIDSKQINDDESQQSKQSSAQVTFIDNHPIYPHWRRFLTAIFLIIFGLIVLVMPIVS